MENNVSTLISNQVYAEIARTLFYGLNKSNITDRYIRGKSSLYNRPYTQFEYLYCRKLFLTLINHHLQKMVYDLSSLERNHIGEDQYVRIRLEIKDEIEEINKELKLFLKNGFGRISGLKQSVYNPFDLEHKYKFCVSEIYRQLKDKFELQINHQIKISREN